MNFWMPMRSPNVPISVSRATPDGALFGQPARSQSGSLRSSRQTEQTRMALAGLVLPGSTILSCSAPTRDSGGGGIRFAFSSFERGVSVTPDENAAAAGLDSSSEAL